MSTEIIKTEPNKQLANLNFINRRITDLDKRTLLVMQNTSGTRVFGISQKLENRIINIGKFSATSIFSIAVYAFCLFIFKGSFR